MYIVRDIFQLKFGHYRPVKALMDEAKEKDIMPGSKEMRLLTDFTGKAYRFIFENSYETLRIMRKIFLRVWENRNGRIGTKNLWIMRSEAVEKF